MLRSGRRPHQGRGSLILLGSVLTVSLSLQGCLAAAWVIAVGADSLRSSDVTFWPFEQSWVSSRKPSEITDSTPLTRLAILPIDGDQKMSNRLTQILRRQTALDVVAPPNFDRPTTGLADEAPLRAFLAKELSRDLKVDAILFGHVAGAPSRQVDWGWKEEESRRLFLYLVDSDGQVLWKDELPFTVVTGTKPAIEDVVQTSLSNHLMDHVRELRLDDLGYLPKKSS